MTQIAADQSLVTLINVFTVAPERQLAQAVGPHLYRVVHVAEAAQ